MEANPIKAKLSGKEMVICAVALTFACFHLYTAATGSMLALFQRAVHYMFAGFLAFMIYPSAKDGKHRILGAVWDIFMAACAVVPIVYMLLDQEWVLTRFFYIEPFTWYQYLFCAMLVVSILEATRRNMGIALPLIAVISIAYMMLGRYLPGNWGNSGFTAVQLVDTLYTTTEGIFGVAIGASATYVVLFVIFGSFLEGSGVGDYFINVAMSLTHNSVGGSAKASVISSCLFGSISGSTIANVATTGQITIPMMKKNGYSKTFAGAVEAVSSSGGQIMPPVMGAAAFIMSEFTGIPYSKIILAALLPALLYYLAVFVMVDLEARKIGIMPSGENDPNWAWKRILKRSYLFLPLVVLVALLIEGYSATYACLFSMIAVIFVSWFDKRTRLAPIKIVQCLIKGAKGTVGVALACACAGIVVGIINYTGIGTRLSSIVLSLSGDNLFAALVLTALAALVLGMGLPTTPSYIVVATLLVPALIRMGIPVIAAHLFAFYFANISGITPPVALAAYTAASLSGGNPMKTGYRAFFLGIASYIVPFMFVYNPALLMVNVTPLELLEIIPTSMIGVFFLGCASEGYFIQKLKIWQRVILLVGAILLIYPGLLTDLAGLSICLFVLGPIYLKNRRQKVTGQPA